MKLTNRFKTIAIVGFSHAVSRNENRVAHGGVCLLQARTLDGVIIGRKINTNGRHQEIGEPFYIDQEILEHWVGMK